MKKINKKIKVFIAAAILLGVAYYFSLPVTLFKDPCSTVLNDKNGNLLSASIASDGQWRFPSSKLVPSKFAEVIVLTEDKRFYNHFGVDPLSMARAIRQNIRAGKVVSGGSTISMQVIRLSRKGKSRTFFEKIIEAILATRLEWRHSKSEILALYSSHAPFGGNVVGLEAACWRYFGRSPSDLSWSEAALLAVLPNNPSLVHLGKNRGRLKQKRDRLLDKLAQQGKIDALSLSLAKAEQVPEAPLALPRLAPHLLTRVIQEGKAGQKIETSIDQNLQQRTIQIIEDHHQRMRANQVHNAAAIIVDVKTGRVLAYVGNTKSGLENNEDVDVITAPRSTGSILKPFLYAAMMNEGQMLPQTLWPDVPTLIGGYAPKNFSREYDGAVPANAALIRSLNVPSVHELREYRYEKFYNLLKNIGVTTLNRPPDHYGLSLVLGGAEANLWDITGAFSSMARTLNNYFEFEGKNRYAKNDFHALTYEQEVITDSHPREESSWLSAVSIYLTFDALKEVYRPGEGSGWKNFSSTKKIAWKTGTSFGSRDAWAVGVNPSYAIGVWVGNADGEGRPGLTGTEAAAPLLFDLFSVLPGNPWFRKPYAEMQDVSVCKQSGHRASSLCTTTERISIAKPGLQTKPCPYHKKIFLTLDKKFRVNSSCEQLSKTEETSWFILPPIEEFYFKKKSASYRVPPPLRIDCENPNTLASIDLIYPKINSKVFIPRELDGSLGNAVFEATHRSSSATIFWHLDGNFISSTTKTHKLSLNPLPGNHTLTIVDENGESISRSFSVISTKN
ncbi:penicillin-binding protein 1C [Cytophagales bacterium WSM2-2]|nr:penicillin-binding protein 1C [Cytophagales bacterium WSM2-2]